MVQLVIAAISDMFLKQFKLLTHYYNFYMAASCLMLFR